MSRPALLDEAFRLTERTLGSDVLQTTFGYYGWTTSNGRGRLNWINSGTSLNPDSLQDLTYTYDANGNVLTIVDPNAGGTQTQTFTYDDLDRIKTAQASGGTGGTYGQDTYTYDANTGNLKTKAGVTNTYGDSNHRTRLQAGQADGRTLTTPTEIRTVAMMAPTATRSPTMKRAGSMV